jgi:hypothetical protein
MDGVEPVANIQLQIALPRLHSILPDEPIFANNAASEPSTCLRFFEPLYL